METVGPDQVLVIDARGQTGAASLGHILCTRLMVRAAAGLVTDGALRDYPASPCTAGRKAKTWQGGNSLVVPRDGIEGDGHVSAVFGRGGKRPAARRPDATG